MKKSKKKNVGFNVLTVFFAVMLTVVSIEMTSLLINSFRIKRKDSLLYDTEESKVFGYVLRKNHSFHAHKELSDGTVVYDVDYHTDRYRRRDVRILYKKSRKHILLFGGSSIYGEGLKDADTLQSFLAKDCQNYNVYNYGVHGYGPSHMLRQLSVLDLEEQVYNRNGVLIYKLISDHIYRVNGTTHVPWIINEKFSSPFYYLDENRMLHDGGDFNNSSRASKTGFYNKFLSLKKKSNFLKLINLNIPLWISEEDIRLVYSVVEASKKAYLRKFNGQFFVLIDPLQTLTSDLKMLINLFKENNISILYYPEIKMEEKYYIPNDIHPNGMLNEILAKKVCKSIKDS